MENQSEGIKRKLTLGETLLARSVFGDEIFYDSVRIHCDSYLPLGLQNEQYVMTPNGELYYRRSLYRRDFSIEPPPTQHLFIHEMTHVWQHQKGMWVCTRGLVSWATVYKYKIDKFRLSDYPMEQQASIIADHFYLKTFGEKAFFRLADRELIGVIDKNTLSKFEPLIRSAGLPL
ncbi:type IV secretion protein Rhs [Kosakonia sp. BYX6]|uniref:Type IV secretion protein Rhs n=1 Tax=Kosakonia calanthes TaxID=3139408 RepID=A0ABZ3B5B5_9ENTR